MRVRRWRTTVLLSAAALGASVALVGCTGGGSQGSASSAPAGADRDVDAAAAERAPALAQGAAGPAQAAPDLRVDQRAIVYTGSLTVRVRNVAVAAEQAASYAVRAGGFVGADKRTSGSGAADATLELRVPAAKFSAVVQQLAGLGSEESRGVDTQDVTEETIDLDARITTQLARVASGRQLLARAKSLGDLVMLEGELAKREADLASLQAKKRRLADLTSLSTITAVLLNAQAAPKDDQAAGFLGGLRSGWHALLASLAVLLTVLGAVLPWLIALGLPLWGAIWLVRRLGRRLAPAQSRPDSSTEPPPTAG